MKGIAVKSKSVVNGKPDRAGAELLSLPVIMLSAIMIHVGDGDTAAVKTKIHTENKLHDSYCHTNLLLYMKALGQ